MVHAFWQMIGLQKLAAWPMLSEAALEAWPLPSMRFKRSEVQRSVVQHAEPHSTHLLAPQYPLQIHLFQERKDWQAGAALILVQVGQHAGALGAGGCQNAACDCCCQRLLQLLLTHLQMWYRGVFRQDPEKPR